MKSDAVNLLADIRRSGGDLRLVGCNKLKLVAPTALLPELAERVRIAKPVLLAALADTDRKATAAHEEGGGVSNPRHSGATAQHLASEALSDCAAPTSSADWRARYREALVHWSSLHIAQEAAGLAWGEMQVRWHQRHGARAPHWQCGGCGEPIGGRATLTLSDGSRVHADELDCLLRFGERWRRAASVGLKALGLDPPAEAAL
jgi:hypothetical protein